jgi:REP element-mobilizing transposase RayT
MPDHAHMLIGLKPDIALSDLMRFVKSDSSEFINRKRLINGRFSWQHEERGVRQFVAQNDRDARAVEARTSTSVGGPCL